MKNITCPHCEQIFEIDAAGYADIVKQVRGTEFEKELHDRLEALSEKHEIEVELTRKEVSEQKAKESLEQEKRIAELEGELKGHATEIELAKREVMEEKAKESYDKDKQIQRLKNELEAERMKVDMAIKDAISPLEKENLTLQGKIDSASTEFELMEKSMNEKHQTELTARDEMLRLKDEEIDRVKDMKMKMSVKDIGEKLEQWCENQFNLVRATAFPHAYFEKDNESVKDEGDSKGTKGDYIFRDSDPSGIEYISIMFEMKDKMEDTKGQTNESHLAKLDKDRRKKNCEYAVLVSMLEPDNELFNSGPVDMSHKYEKMYVVRPQDFMLILSLIRNEARKSLEMRNELAVIRDQNIDYENFENKLLEFQDGFGKNYETAKKYYEMAIKDIDDTIKKLEKIKASLTTSGRQLRLANDKTQDLSIKKLTRGNPTMKAKFDDLNIEK
tara:strand:- start:1377 stop:2708 length:1332 start_codon:yes stop_codon:yes gene_type:complete